VRFPEPLYCRTLAQTFETSIEVVAYVSEWLIEPLADLSQFQPLEVVQFESPSLHVRKVFERREEMREIDSETHLALNVVLPL